MIKSTVFKISGMHCTSCAMNIDGELEDTEGVKNVSTSYAKQEVLLSFDPTIVSEEEIIAKIKKIGYILLPKHKPE